MTYAIRFDFPDSSLGISICYAGLHQGAAGFAPTLNTAWFYEDSEIALQELKAAYPDAIAKWGKVVTIRDGGPA